MARSCQMLGFIMPFLPTELSPDLLRHLALGPKKAVGSSSYEVFRHSDGNAYFFREYQSDGREWNLHRSEIRIRTHTYKVVEGTRFVSRNGQSREILMSLTATSDDSLTQYRRRQLRTYLLDLVPVLGKSQHRDFRLILVDATAPRRPRSVSWLVRYLNRLAPQLQRPQLIHCQELFLSALYEDEIELLSSYVHRTDGKALTPLALLVFELGLARRPCRRPAS